MGPDHGVQFPEDFVDFISPEFGGTIMDEEWGYQYIPEDEQGTPNSPVSIGYFLHFDRMW